MHRETRDQYGSWPLTADARRYLYLKYAISPAKQESGDKPKDIWKEAAAQLDPVIGGRIVDIGASSGYFIEKLLQRGHRQQSEIIGIDKAASHFPVLEDWLKDRYSHPSLWLREGDAAGLNIESNSADAATGLFLAYHMPRPHRLFSEIHRIVKPGGLVIFSGRSVDNLTNLWTTAQIVAKQHDAVMPQSNFYSHFPFDKLYEAIDQSKKFKVVEVREQKGSIFIPATQEGWEDFRDGVLSYMPLMRHSQTQKQFRYGEIKDFLNEDIRSRYFESLAAQYNNYFPDRLHQGFVVAENVK